MNVDKKNTIIFLVILFCGFFGMAETSQAAMADNLVSAELADPGAFYQDGRFLLTGTWVVQGGSPIIGPADLQNLKNYTSNDPINKIKRANGENPPNPPVWGTNAIGSEIIQVGSKYLLYFQARKNDPALNCLGVAVADAIGGVYFPTTYPLYCAYTANNQYEVIDSSPFYDNGQLYLAFAKYEIGKPGLTRIELVKLSDDGLSFAEGETPIELIKKDQPWELSHIEAPELIKFNNKYYLFYSGSGWNTTNNSYAVGYATADSLFGPYTKAPENENPILNSAKSGLFNPGSASIIKDSCGNYLMFFSAFRIDVGVTIPDSRKSYVTKLYFDASGKAVVDTNFDIRNYSCFDVSRPAAPTGLAVQ